MTSAPLDLTGRAAVVAGALGKDKKMRSLDVPYLDVPYKENVG
jgi:hypothetical protein